MTLNTNTNQLPSVEEYCEKEVREGRMTEEQAQAIIDAEYTGHMSY